MVVIERLPRAVRRTVAAVTSQPPVQFLLTLANRIGNDDVAGLAAEMAYRFLFALFPFLIFLAAFVGFIGPRIGLDNLFESVMQLVGPLFPPEIQQLLGEWVEGVLQTQSTSLLTLGAAGALYGAAGGVGTLVKGLNRAYGVRETRGFWGRQALGLLTAVALAILMVGGVVLYTLGEWLGDLLVARFGLGDLLPLVLDVLRGPGLAVGLCLVMVGLYRLLPNVNVRVLHAIPGAVLATAAWIILTLGFSFYLAHFGSYDRVFGSLGTAVVLMVWLYVVAMILLIGGEANALIAGQPTQTGASHDTEVGMHVLDEIAKG